VTIYAELGIRVTCHPDQRQVAEASAGQRVCNRVCRRDVRNLQYTAGVAHPVGRLAPPSISSSGRPPWTDEHHLSVMPTTSCGTRGSR
jgi:hypothetical protein